MLDQGRRSPPETERPFETHAPRSEGPHTEARTGLEPACRHQRSPLATMAVPLPAAEGKPSRYPDASTTREGVNGKFGGQASCPRAYEEHFRLDAFWPPLLAFAKSPV